MLRVFQSREFLYFLLCGGVAAAVNFGSRILYSQWVSYSVAIIFAYITGMVTAFLLARSYVFTASQSALHKSALLFIAVNVLAVIQTWLVSVALSYFLEPYVEVKIYRESIAHAVGVLVPVFSSYLGHKYITFR